MEIMLTNSALRVYVRPDLGGRIDQLADIRTEKDWLYHPRTYDQRPQDLRIGASFDDHWTGGWNDIFPTDAPCEFQGYTLPVHGELWSQTWNVTEQGKDFVKLVYDCQSIPVKVEKSIKLLGQEAACQIRYRFRLEHNKALPFLFKLHPAIAIESGDTLFMPSCQIEPVDLNFSTLIGKEGPTKFPLAFDAKGQTVDLGKIPPPTAKSQEFVYATKLGEGPCGIYNPQTNSSFNLEFDRSDFPYVWLFLIYGKWRDHYVAVIEPCTNIPWDLEKAFAQETSAILYPNEEKSYTVTARILEG